MEKVYSLTGIDCPVCASKLEGKISKAKGVEEAFINFFSSKLIVEYKNTEYKIVEDEIFKIIKKFEPEAELKEV